MNDKDLILGLMGALAEQQGAQGADKLFFNLMNQLLQPEPDPEQQLRELLAQSMLNKPEGPDFSAAREVLRGSDLGALIEKYGTPQDTSPLSQLTAQKQSQRISELAQGSSEEQQLAALINQLPPTQNQEAEASYKAPGLKERYIQALKQEGVPKAEKFKESPSLKTLLDLVWASTPFTVLPEMSKVGTQSELDYLRQYAK